MKTRVESRLPQWKRQTDAKMDNLLGIVAGQIETEAKMKAPKSKSIGKGGKKGTAPGALKSSGRHIRLKPLKYEVRFGENQSGAYARFQEYGGDGNRVVRR